jgi:tetratricopeptide (TPR) repeat protein
MRPDSDVFSRNIRWTQFLIEEYQRDNTLFRGFDATGCGGAVGPITHFSAEGRRCLRRALTALAAARLDDAERFLGEMDECGIIGVLEAASTTLNTALINHVKKMRVSEGNQEKAARAITAALEASPGELNTDLISRVKKMCAPERMEEEDKRAISAALTTGSNVINKARKLCEQETPISGRMHEEDKSAIIAALKVASTVMRTALTKGELELTRAVHAAKHLEEVKRLLVQEDRRPVFVAVEDAANALEMALILSARKTRDFTRLQESYRSAALKALKHASGKLNIALTSRGSNVSTIDPAAGRFLHKDNMHTISESLANASAMVKTALIHHVEQQSKGDNATGRMEKAVDFVRKEDRQALIRALEDASNVQKMASLAAVLEEALMADAPSIARRTAELDGCGTDAVISLLKHRSGALKKALSILTKRLTHASAIIECLANKVRVWDQDEIDQIVVALEEDACKCKAEKTIKALEKTTSELETTLKNIAPGPSLPKTAGDGYVIVEHWRRALIALEKYLTPPTIEAPPAYFKTRRLKSDEADIRTKIADLEDASDALEGALEDGALNGRSLERKADRYRGAVSKALEAASKALDARPYFNKMRETDRKEIVAAMERASEALTLALRDCARTPSFSTAAAAAERLREVRRQVVDEDRRSVMAAVYAMSKSLGKPLSGRTAECGTLAQGEAEPCMSFLNSQKRREVLAALGGAASTLKMTLTIVSLQNTLAALDARTTTRAEEGPSCLTLDDDAKTIQTVLMGTSRALEAVESISDEDSPLKHLFSTSFAGTEALRVAVEALDAASKALETALAHREEEPSFSARRIVEGKYRNVAVDAVQARLADVVPRRPRNAEDLPAVVEALQRTSEALQTPPEHSAQKPSVLAAYESRSKRLADVFAEALRSTTKASEMCTISGKQGRSPSDRATKRHQSAAVMSAAVKTLKQASKLLITSLKPRAKAQIFSESYFTEGKCLKAALDQFLGPKKAGLSQKNSENAKSGHSEQTRPEFWRQMMAALAVREWSESVTLSVGGVAKKLRKIFESVEPCEIRPASQECAGGWTVSAEWKVCGDAIETASFLRHYYAQFHSSSPVLFNGEGLIPADSTEKLRTGLVDEHNEDQHPAPGTFRDQDLYVALHFPRGDEIPLLTTIINFLRDHSFILRLELKMVLEYLSESGNLTSIKFLHSNASSVLAYLIEESVAETPFFRYILRQHLGMTPKRARRVLEKVAENARGQLDILASTAGWPISREKGSPKLADRDQTDKATPPKRKQPTIEYEKKKKF